MKTILLVEDEAALLYALQAKFRVEGFTVVIADNGKSALQILEGVVPTIAVLDIILPGVDGLDILKKIKADERFKDTKVVILTNITDDSHRKTAQELGVDSYLLKAEFAIDDIVEKIKKIVE